MYRLQLSPNAFIKQTDNNELVITNNPNEVITFDRIGDAMKEAVLLMKVFETHIYVANSSSFQ